MLAIYIVLFTILFLYACMVHYAGIMNLKRARDAGNMSMFLWAWAMVILVVGYVLDFVLQMVVGTLLFLELPREALLTPRLIRLKKGAGWRSKLAGFICTNYLDPLDPSGCHCKSQ